MVGERMAPLAVVLEDVRGPLVSIAMWSSNDNRIRIDTDTSPEVVSGS